MWGKSWLCTTTTTASLGPSFLTSCRVSQPFSKSQINPFHELMIWTIAFRLQWLAGRLVVEYIFGICPGNSSPSQTCVRGWYVWLGLPIQCFFCGCRCIFSITHQQVFEVSVLWLTFCVNDYHHLTISSQNISYKHHKCTLSATEKMLNRHESVWWIDWDGETPTAGWLALV